MSPTINHLLPVPICGQAFARDIGLATQVMLANAKSSGVHDI